MSVCVPFCGAWVQQMLHTLSLCVVIYAANISVHIFCCTVMHFSVMSESELVYEVCCIINRGRYGETELEKRIRPLM